MARADVVRRRGVFNDVILQHWCAPLRGFSTLERCRLFATWFDRLARRSFAFVHITGAMIWIR
jgi:transposase